MEEYQKLEIEYAEFCGWNHTVVCSSGTAALHLAFETLRVTEGWEGLENPRVVVPDFTMIACARAVVLAGMVPMFKDVDDLGLLGRSNIGPHIPTAVLAVHTYGRRCPTRFGNIPVIEDLSEAHGIQPSSTSLAACWSFYHNKVIAGEEGGCVAFQTKKQADLAKSLRSMGFTEAHDFTHIPRGMNYRLSNANASLIRKSLKSFSLNLQLRKLVQGWYDEMCPEQFRLPNREVPWVYDLELPPGVDLDEVVKDLQAHGIAARHGFKPLSQQQEFVCIANGRTPTTERLARTRMYLPVAPTTTKQMVRRNMEALERAIETVGAV